MGELTLDKTSNQYALCDKTWSPTVHGEPLYQSSIGFRVSDSGLRISGAGFRDVVQGYLAHKKQPLSPIFGGRTWSPTVHGEPLYQSSMYTVCRNGPRAHFQNADTVFTCCVRYSVWDVARGSGSWKTKNPEPRIQGSWGRELRSRAHGVGN